MKMARDSLALLKIQITYSEVSLVCFLTVSVVLKSLDIVMFRMTCMLIGHYVMKTAVFTLIFTSCFKYSVSFKKCRMCASAVLQILKQSFLHFESAIRNLDSADFEKAATQEHACEGFTDPTMKSLHETITAVHTKVDGTDEACI